MAIELANAVAAIMRYVCPTKQVQLTWLPPLDADLPRWSVTLYSMEHPLGTVTVNSIAEFATWLAAQQAAGLLASI